MEKVITTAEIELLLKFERKEQVDAYRILKESKIKELELEVKLELRKLEVTKSIKLVMRITTLISVFASAVAILIEAIIPIF